MGESGKVNSAILYKNELNPEKQAITQSERGHSPPGDQVQMKDKSIHSRDGDM